MGKTQLIWDAKSMLSVKSTEGMREVSLEDAMLIDELGGTVYRAWIAVEEEDRRYCYRAFFIKEE